MINFAFLVIPAEQLTSQQAFSIFKLPVMNESLIARLQEELEGIRQAGLFKKERIIESPQGAVIQVNGKEVINLCANNYLSPIHMWYPGYSQGT